MTILPDGQRSGPQLLFSDVLTPLLQRVDEEQHLLPATSRSTAAVETLLQAPNAWFAVALPSTNPPLV